MYAKPELRLNQFRDVKIPANKEYFLRFGVSQSPTGDYSGEDVAEFSKRKLENIADIEAYDRMKQEEELSKSV